MVSIRIRATPTASGATIYIQRDWCTVIFMDDKNANSAENKSTCETSKGLYESQVREE